MPSQLTETTAPAWYLAVMPVSESGVVTAWPLTEKITSPAVRPLAFAAVPHRTPRIRAPLFAGAMLAGMLSCWLLPWQRPWRPPGTGPLLDCCSSEACCRGFALVLCATSTPRKPGRPMYTVELLCPPAICLAIDRALLIGLAKPRVPPGRPEALSASPSRD